MESTSHYHLILFQFFSEHGYDVIVVNPLQSNSMKDFSIRKRKTDRVDAFKLAMMYRTKTLRPSQIPQTATRALRQLCRHRAELLNDVSSYKKRLTALLDQAMIKSFPLWEASLLALCLYVFQRRPFCLWRKNQNWLK